MKQSFTIRDLPLSERPRERLVKFGPEALSAQEILSLILGRGVSGESVLITAQRLLSEFGSLKGIADASLEELSQVRGIGLAKAAQLKAAFELSRRLDEQYLLEEKGQPLKTPECVVELIKKELKGKKREHFLLVLLTIRNQPIRMVKISEGSLDSSIVHPREVYKEAISAHAASVILVHNHPSGDPEPSPDDIKLTKRLVEAGKLMGISVLDHIIVTDQNHLSMRSRGLL